ncbi:MAG: adenine deaminase [Desulfocurvibacter africanus]
MTHAGLARHIRIAWGQEPADLLVRDVRLVNVLSGEIHPAHVAVADGLVVGFEEIEAREVLDAQGRFCCPGLLDGHIHIESSLLTPPRFAEAAAAHGTAAVVCDPHEIANVLGAPGVEYMLDASESLPLAFYFMAPSCVPATHLETSGAELDAGDIRRLLEKYPRRMPGLGEMMNYPGLLASDPSVLAKLEAARGRVIDGHAPLLSGRDLSAYVLAGPASDHECISADEALEKLRKGMHLMLREGTQEHNMADLLPAVNEYNSQRASFVSDDRLASDLLKRGHLDATLRRAMSLGLPPVRAVQMATINTARYFGLDRSAGHGAVAPGFRADFMLLDDLESFRIRACYLGGRDVRDLDFSSRVAAPGNSMRVKDLDKTSLRIPAGRGRLRVIGVQPGQIVTQHLLMEPRLEDGQALADPQRDLAKLAVFERHRATGNVGLGFVTGLGLKRGAMACSVAHDSHNLIVAGASDADMLTAAREVQRMGGGLAVAFQGRILAKLALPVAGLMSDAPAAEVAAGEAEVNRALAELGMGLANPFAALSFLALPVIPTLKLTDKGLVDVARFEYSSLWEE